MSDGRDGPNPGKVVLVSTPIGNLGDISLRAIETLRTSDWIYAEDTRHSAGLLQALGISATGRMRSLHAHNEEQKSAEVVHLVLAGAVVAFVSDAGTPGISDPAERLVRACIAAGVRVEMVPGANALLPALVLSGLAVTPFVYMGFLERKGEARARQLAMIAASSATSVLYESPKRLAATLQDLADTCGASRQAAVARELTKLFEQIERGTLDSLMQAIEDKRLPERGECVIVVAPTAGEDSCGDDSQAIDDEIRELSQSGMRSRDLADAITAKFGVTRRDAYERVLEQTKANATGRR